MDAKMSKSKPDSAIFIHDDFANIQRKVKKAYCPEGVLEGNPVLETARHILFMHFDELRVPRKFEEDVVFTSYEDLARRYQQKELHPLDLKEAVAEHLEQILSPIRTYFNKHPTNLEKLLSYME